MSTFLNLQVQVINSTKITELSTWDLIMDSNSGIGWMINLILLGMFGYSIYIISERFQTLKRSGREEEDFVVKIKSLLLEGNMEAAKKYCTNSESPSARMLEKGIARIGKPTESIAGSMENTGKLEVIRMKRRLRFLIMTAGAAPLLGLLGTAFSLYGMYSLLDNSPVLSTKVLSHGTMTAMVTTTAGLLIGAISYTGYHFLMSKVETITYQMEKDAIEFMDLLFHPGK